MIQFNTRTLLITRLQKWNKDEQKKTAVGGFKKTVARMQICMRATAKSSILYYKNPFDTKLQKFITTEKCDSPKI
jgi:hypothetical protein